MDAADRTSEAENSCPRRLVPPSVARRRAPRIERTPRASKRPRLVCPVVGHRFVDEAVKFPRCRVRFDLTVPNLGVEFREPLPEVRKLLRGQALDQKLEFFHGAHG